MCTGRLARDYRAAIRLPATLIRIGTDSIGAG
ncbi:hypothetical protein SAMN05216276_103582 [Streptosporangium subroseum]|uniref:Uncharacterized protein n=1 Tax=Streptosporangium subroseum TaxID=106412 RepID=A0A239LWC9_9ACTN|nr:hypothetical protein SAMN05216276_103582 [Streptosporangium subroseum]